MEFSVENSQLQVSTLIHETSNQATSFLNEDIAITTEKIIEKPDLVLIEKESVIKKKVIMKKKLLPQNGTSLPHQPMGANTSLFIDERARFSYSEQYNQDRDEFHEMEVSSQGSAHSAMDISSQGSADSKMDISRQGSSNQDSDITPSNGNGVQNKRKVSKRKAFVDPVEDFLLQPATASGISKKRDNKKTEKIKKLKVERKKKDSIVRKAHKFKKSKF